MIAAEPVVGAVYSSRLSRHRQNLVEVVQVQVCGISVRSIRSHGQGRGGLERLHSVGPGEFAVRFQLHKLPKRQKRGRKAARS